jgi:trehalose-phosphatase
VSGTPIALPLHRALAHVASYSKVLVALDFDGTLAPLVDDPRDARPTPAASRALGRLAREPGVRLALVSGRPAADVARLADAPPGALLVGSHGAELGEVLPDGTAAVRAAELTGEEALLRTRLADALDALAEGRPGVWVEHKPFSVTLHARRASLADRRAALTQALAGPATLPGVHAMRGKDVVELRVRSVTKGDALRVLREDVPGVAVLYAGDDVTDEDALRALGPDDVGIKVGSGASAARHRVSDPDALAAVLDDLLLLRRAL